MNSTGQSGGTPNADIDAPEAWDVGSADVASAVIDERVDIGHPELRGNIRTNPGEAAGNRVDDGNGYVDDVNGYGFANDAAGVYDRDPIPGGRYERGTHVAGTIAAGNNGTGITGAGWRTRIMPLKFLGADGGYTSEAMEAITTPSTKA